MRFQAPRGTQDVLPQDVHRWLRLESVFRNLVGKYGYSEIRTPTFEETDLFVRSSGETSEIVTKQMYSFEDKGGRSITLKPEGTAPAMRSLIEHSLCPSGAIARLAYVTPIFRYERPQKGRLREAHQVGLELVGASSPAADAEVIDVTVQFYRDLGIPDVKVLLNSLGRKECRDRYQEAILNHAASYIASQDPDIQARIQKNPLRLLDSKDPEAQEALKGVPEILEFLEEDSKANFNRLQKLLTTLNVPFEVTPSIVRGLDYYTETVFEVQSTKLGAQSSLCGGGRYDLLIKELGGAATPSVGVAMGVERALIVMEETGVEVPNPKPHVFVVQATAEAELECLKIARDLRLKGVSVVTDPEARSLKSQLRQADRAGASIAIILGADELAKGTVVVRELATSAQEEIPMADLFENSKVIVG